MAKTAAQIWKELSEPFPAGVVKWRVKKKTKKDPKKAEVLCYVDARNVMAKLDEVVGPNNWQTRGDRYGSKGARIELGIRIEGEWIWKSDVGEDSNYSPLKGGWSDALKRAAVHFGVNRAAYAVPRTYARLDNFGYILQGEKARLRAVYNEVVKKWKASSADCYYDTEEEGEAEPEEGTGPAEDVPKDMSQEELAGLEEELTKQKEERAQIAKLQADFEETVTGCVSTADLVKFMKEDINPLIQSDANTKYALDKYRELEKTEKANATG